MYEEFYGFTESPFSLTPDPKFFYHGDSHLRALELLRYGIHRGEGFMIVTGEIGTGKTTLWRTVLAGADQNLYTVLLPNPFLSETDLLRGILEDFGILSKETSAATQAISKDDMLKKLNEFLLSVHGLGARALLLIDEAQNIPVPTLEQIRILSNLETDKKKLLQIVLVGQPELKEVLARPDLRQLNQRLSIRCELSALSQPETVTYLEHRLRIASAGSPKVSFNRAAIQTIYAYSGGTPRLINLIAERCMIIGVATQARVIDRKVVREAVAALELRKTAPAGGLSVAVRIAIVILGTVIISALILWALRVR